MNDFFFPPGRDKTKIKYSKVRAAPSISFIIYSKNNMIHILA